MNYDPQAPGSLLIDRIDTCPPLRYDLETGRAGFEHHTRELIVPTQYTIDPPCVCQQLLFFQSFLDFGNDQFQAMTL
jgi:hypothetical protein